MMPVVRINDATFADLKSIATWFGTATPAETIDRVVREAMEKLGIERDDPAEGAATISDAGVMKFEIVPGLSFTKPMVAAINGKPISNPRWSTILRAAITQVKSTGLSADRLVRELSIPSKVEPYNKDGFTYYPTLGLSYQGQSANDVWREVERLANKFGFQTRVEFSWRQTAKAQYPGRVGILEAGKR